MARKKRGVRAMNEMERYSEKSASLLWYVIRSVINNVITSVIRYVIKLQVQNDKVLRSWGFDEVLSSTKLGRKVSRSILVREEES